MTSTPWDTQEIAMAPLVTAPDGSAVRVLCATARGGTATFTLEPGAVPKAVVHWTVEEIWYVAAGQGRLWRKTRRD
jgi:mannose-6-phosphate isomerase-like protein (cupin superfamily)